MQLCTTLSTVGVLFPLYITQSSFFRTYTKAKSLGVQSRIIVTGCNQIVTVSDFAHNFIITVRHVAILLTEIVDVVGIFTDSVVLPIKSERIIGTVPCRIAYSIFYDKYMTFHYSIMLLTKFTVYGWQMEK